MVCFSLAMLYSPMIKLSQQSPNFPPCDHDRIFEFCIDVTRIRLSPSIWIALVPILRQVFNPWCKVLSSAAQGLFDTSFKSLYNHHNTDDYEPTCSGPTRPTFCSFLNTIISL